MTWTKQRESYKENLALLVSKIKGTMCRLENTRLSTSSKIIVYKAKMSENFGQYMYLRYIPNSQVFSLLGSFT